MDAHFQVDHRTEGSIVVLLLRGELDVSSSPILEESLGGLADTSAVVLDLTQLEFIDSTGLGVLVKAHQRRRDAGDQLALIQGGGQVKRLLELTGLNQQLHLITQVDELSV